MSNFSTLSFDTYDLKARIQPSLSSMLPLFIVGSLLIDDFGAIWATIGTVVLYCGAVMLMTQLARDRGKKLEPVLYKEWGGRPSMAMLRHRDTRLGKTTKARYRAFLTASVPGLELASPDLEEQSPEQADDGYESATSWLLTRTRDHDRFGLIFQENINYGFRRNTWALQPWALAVDLIAVVTVCFVESDAWTGEIASTLVAMGNLTWTCLAITVAHGLLFSFYIRRNWVRVAAEAYAYQLLAACDTMAE